MSTGSSANGNSGAMALSTSALTGSGTGGNFTVLVGDSVSGNGGSLIVTAGSVVNTLGGDMGGNLTMKAGDSNADSGESSSLSAGASTLGGHLQAHVIGTYAAPQG